MPIYLDLYQPPKDDHGSTNANNMVLQLHPHKAITNKKVDVRCQSIWAYSNLQQMIMGKQMPTTWTYN
jgi:hypothetical protein